MQTDKWGGADGKGNGAYSQEAAQGQTGAHAGNGFEATPSHGVMLGITGLRAFHSTELEGRKEGFQMTVNTAQGTSYDIGIPPEVYDALISVFEAEREAVRHPQYAPQQVPLVDTDHPTGSPEEVATVQSMLQQMEPQDEDVFSITDEGQSVLSKIGFVSDEQMDRSEEADPVEEVLFLAEQGEEEQETGDALMEYGEESEEDIGQL